MLGKVYLRIAIAIIAAGGCMLALLMGWSVWKLHALTVIFWELAFSVIMICFVVRSLLKPPPGRRWWKRYLMQLAVALVISVGGALATPALNHWLRG